MKPWHRAAGTGERAELGGKRDTDPEDSNSTPFSPSPPTPQGFKDARGSTLNQEKGIPAANLTPPLTYCVTLSQFLSLSGPPLPQLTPDTVSAFSDTVIGGLEAGQVIDARSGLPAGRVLVHCAMGVSRSATVVLAFLMIYENMTLVEAIQTVQTHRDICPNSGFLRQLQVLDNRLGRETGRL